MVSPVALAKSGRVFNKFWNTVLVKNHQQPVELAASIADVIGSVPKGKIYFRFGHEANMLEMQPSMLSIVEFVSNPSFQIHVPRNYPNKEALQTIKACLAADKPNEATRIAAEFLDKLRAKKSAYEKGLHQYLDRLA